MVRMMMVLNIMSTIGAGSPNVPETFPSSMKYSMNDENTLKYKNDYIGYTFASIIVLHRYVEVK